MATIIAIDGPSGAGKGTTGVLPGAAAHAVWGEMEISDVRGSPSRACR